MNSFFSKNITYVEYARSGVVYYTDNVEKVSRLKEKGWNFNQYADGFRVIPPEECIVDITNYKKVMQYNNPIINLAYYDFLNDLIESNSLKRFINRILENDSIYYSDFDYLISNGPVLDTEIRIAGSDDRIKKLKMDMLEDFLNNSKYKVYIDKVKKEIGKPKILEHYKQPLSERNITEQIFYKEIDQNICLMKKMDCYNPNIDRIYNLDKISNKIDVILFIPFGCFKYLSSFTNKKNINKIMFWEIHAERNKGKTFKLFEKQLTDKNVLIVDNMYSGKTMKIAKKKVEELGGKPIILGINPKNKNNIVESDYSMVLNNIFSKEELNIKDKELFRNMYIRIFKNN